MNQNQSDCPVSSHNEWDPLEEVIVGRLEGLCNTPYYHKTLEAVIPREMIDVITSKRDDIDLFPEEFINLANKERREFINILKGEGVIVREPDIVNFDQEFKTPFWSSYGHLAAFPRDSLLVIGNEIIEAPMSWRSRHFETAPYRSLLKEYFNKGAGWVSAPKPLLEDSVYNDDYTQPRKGEPIRYIINDTEPLFDAADFMRFGEDILALKSNSANQSGINWLRRYLGDAYRVREITSKYPLPMHIDDHMMPLEAGRLLINPEYIDKESLPDIFKKWEILEAPRPDEVSGGLFFDNSSIAGMWFNMNMLVLGDGKIVAEASQTSTIKALKEWGFTPIPCPYINYTALGGVFHCSTIDIRRDGELKSYF